MEMDAAQPEQSKQVGDELWVIHQLLQFAMTTAVMGRLSRQALITETMEIKMTMMAEIQPVR